MNSDLTTQAERELLGAIMLDKAQWSHAKTNLSTSDFQLSSHSLIFGCINAMVEDEKPVDHLSVAQELDKLGKLQSVGDYAYLSQLVGEGATVLNVASRVESIKEASTQRKWEHGVELLGLASGTATRTTCLTDLQNLCNGTAGRADWRGLFHSFDEVINAPPARFAIEGFLQEEGITLIGGLAGHGKTLCMLAMVRALLEGSKLFHHFDVKTKSERVIYLIPEAGLGPFSARLKTFHLQEYVQAGRLFVRTLSAQGQLSLTDPRLLEAVKGADVFLDTAIRFMDGAEDAESSKVFADTLFGLQRAGARLICGAHHSPKNFGKDTVMTLENVLRGSGDIGAMLATCWGLSQIDATSNRIFIQNVKARDFSACEPFIIQGRPSIDASGYFELTNPPGFAGTLSDNKPQVGRPQNSDTEDKKRQAQQLQAEHKSYKEIAGILGVPRSTVGFWLGKPKGVQ